MDRIQETSQPNTNISPDFKKVIQDSEKALANEPTKRKRRTKAEIEQSKIGTSFDRVQATQSGTTTGLQSGNGFSGNQTFSPIDRTKELKPAFKMYSEIFFAKPIGIKELALSEEEAEALAQVTSNLMNAFPEWFNQDDPKIKAILGMMFIAGPIGYSKYKIYRIHQIQNTPKNEIQS